MKVRACLQAGTAVDLRLPPKLTRENQATRQTPLMAAAEKGHRPVVAMLLKAGANPNALDEFRHTALAKAVNANRTQVVELLLKAGADPNLRLYDGDFALRWAAIRGIDLRITKLLLAHGADVLAHQGGGTALHIAAFSGRVDVAKLLLKAGADANGPRNIFGGPLICALLHGQPKMVDFLLEHGVDPQRQPEALAMAAYQGKLQTVHRLLTLGIDPNTRVYKGRTPLEHARSGKRRAVIKALLAAGAH